MSDTFERRFGNKSTFSIKMTLLPDPDAGEASTGEMSESWGAFELWAGGRNITLHQEQDQTFSAVHWYVLPLLEWFAENWNVLFHEERLPVEVAGYDAFTSLRQTIAPTIVLSEDEEDRRESEWLAWWRRHCIQAARHGGLIPEVIFRRWHDMMEISWGAAPISGAPSDYKYSIPAGMERVRIEEVAPYVNEFLAAVAEAMSKRLPSSTRIKRLLNAIGNLQKTSNQSEREYLSAAIGSKTSAMARKWEQITKALSEKQKVAREYVLQTEQSNLVVTGRSQVALLFGAVSPSVTSGDIEILVDLLASRYKANGEPDELTRLLRYEGIANDSVLPWIQGYELAERALESLQVDQSEAVDVEDVLGNLGVTIEDVHLSDKEIRGISIASPNHTPTICVNTSYQWNNEPHVRRFTLAHELCHLLHDRGFGRRLAIASGPWAPADIEKRANAFAAMFLMPEDALSKAIASVGHQVKSFDDLRKVASWLKTGTSATVEHLYNNRIISKTIRQHFRAREQDDVIGELQ